MKKCDTIFKPTVLVTGANGLLGVNTILELLSQGYLVKGFLRDKNKFPNIKNKNLELVEGDILDYNNLCLVMANVQCVVHIAAMTHQNILKYDDYKKVNVEGTKNVIDVAIKFDVLRFIYIGTSNVFGYGTLNDLGNESKEMKPPFNKAFYALSKLEAQEYVCQQKNKIEVVTVNPTFLIGAYGSAPSSGKIVLMALHNKFVICPPGGRNFVGVKDVAKGIERALKHGKNGESYLLSNKNLTFKQFFKLLRTYTSNEFYLIQLPKFAFTLLGYVGSLLRVFKVRTNLSIENMKALCIHNYYSNKKAKSELNLVFNPIEKGVADAVNWFGKNK